VAGVVALDIESILPPIGSDEEQVAKAKAWCKKHKVDITILDQYALEVNERGFQQYVDFEVQQIGDREISIFPQLIEKWMETDGTIVSSDKDENDRMGRIVKYDEEEMGADIIYAHFVLLEIGRARIDQLRFNTVQTHCNPVVKVLRRLSVLSGTLQDKSRATFYNLYKNALHQYLNDNSLDNDLTTMFSTSFETFASVSWTQASKRIRLQQNSFSAATLSTKSRYNCIALPEIGKSLKDDLREWFGFSDEGVGKPIYDRLPPRLNVFFLGGGLSRTTATEYISWEFRFDVIGVFQTGTSANSADRVRTTKLRTQYGMRAAVWQLAPDNYFMRVEHYEVGEGIWECQPTVSMATKLRKDITRLHEDLPKGAYLVWVTLEY
jgi:hypothetical protein